MSDSNRAKVRIARESSWGATPANGPATRELRFTSEGLVHDKQTVESGEIDASRQTTDMLEVGQAANGPINVEFSYDNYEDLLETAVRGTIASTRVAMASVTVAASSITRPTGGNFLTAFAVGQYVKFKSGGHADTGAVRQIRTLSSTTMGLAGSALTASVCASAAVLGRTLTNGVTKTSYFIEVDFQDANTVKYFNGMANDQTQLTLASGQIITGVFTFMGKRGFEASASVASTVVASANTNTAMTAAVNVAEIRENGNLLTDAVQNLNLTIANAMRPKPRVASKTGDQHGDGKIAVTGNLTMYLARKALLSSTSTTTQRRCRSP